MKPSAYFQYQLKRMLLRPRWLMIFPVVGFIAYLSSNAIALVGSEYPPMDLTMLPDAFGMVTNQVNGWDAFFIAFGNLEYLVLGTLSLFLLCVSDILPESEFGNLALFRLGSRRRWWGVKSAVTLIAAALYLALCMAIVFAAGVIRNGFDLNWSAFGASGTSILTPAMMKFGYTAPMRLAFIVFMMQTLGFWTLGMVMMILTLRLGKPLWGHLAVMVLCAVTFPLEYALINVPSLISILSPLRNLTMVYWAFPFRQGPIWWSFAYWLIWIAVLNLIGRKLCECVPLVSKHDSKEEGRA